MPAQPSIKTPRKQPLYEGDLYLWSLQQAALLREGRLNEIDRMHIAEELDDVGSELYERLESALTVLLMHMLKWDYQQARRSRSWEATIREQRKRIEKLLKKNPHLKSRYEEALEDGYQYGRDRASAETDMAVATFPPKCPYSRDDIMKREFSFDPIDAHHEPDLSKPGKSKVR